LEKSKSISDLLDEWTQGIEIQISNPKVILGNRTSSIEFSGNIRSSGIKVVNDGIFKDIQEYKTGVRIVCCTREQLTQYGNSDIGKASVSENEITIKLALYAEIFYPSVQLLNDSSNLKILHMECKGLEMQEPFLIWNPNNTPLTVYDASIGFLPK
jgi:hypothetical protein